MSFKSSYVRTRNRKCLAIFCIVLLDLLIIGSVMNLGEAQQTVSVVAEPYHSSTRPYPVIGLRNETVQIELALTKYTSVSNIIRFKFVLKYATAVLDTRDVLIGSFLYDDNANVAPYINEALGEVGLDVQLPTADAKSGTGTLATILFKGMTLGLSPLTLSAGAVQLWSTEGELNVLPESASLQIVKTKLYVDPRLTSNKTVGEDFDIMIKLESVENLAGFELKLNWTASVLDLVKINLFKLWGGNTFVAPNDTSVAGRYWFGEAGLYPAAPFTGNTTLATLTFRVKGKGNFAFDLYGVKMGDNSKPTVRIMSAVIDGYFSNVATKLSAPIVVDSFYQPGTTFLANLTVSEVEFLYGFEIKLRYDTAILTALDVKLPDGHLLEPLNPTLINFSSNIRDDLGLVRVSANLMPPEAARSGTGVLIAVVFNVTAVGSSKLDLFSTKLFDQDGVLLTHSAQNGEFTNWRNVAILGIIASPATLKAGGNVTIEIELVNSGAGTQSANLTESFKAHLARTEVFQVEEIQSNFTLSHLPIVNGSEIVMVSGIVQNRSVDYQLNYTSGNLTFALWPPVPSNVTVTYMQIKEGNITAVTGIELLSRQSRTLSSNWDTRGLEYFAGVYNITVESETAVDDNPADNVASTQVTLRPLIHDVAIMSLYPQPNRVKVGDSVQIWISVKNLGTETETFNLTLYGGNSAIGGKDKITLKSRYAELMGFTWDTTGLPLGTYEIKSVISNVTGESRTDNNAYVSERDVFILQTLEEAVTLPLTTIAFAAAIVVILVVAVIYLLRRSRP